MALLYKQKMTSDITPSEPDYKPEQAVQQKAQNIETLAQKQELWELKKQQEQVDWQNKTYKNAILKTYKIGQVSYGDDVEGYRKYVGEETKKIWDQVPDGEAKTRMMAEVQIEAEVFDAQVVANNNKKIATQNKNIQRENVLRMVYSGETGLRNTIGSILLPDANVSPDQAQKMKQTFADSVMMLQQANDSKDDKDENGNYLLTVSERNEIEKAYKNAGRNALLGFASDNLDYNRQGVVNTYDYLKNNRAEVLKKYNMDGEQYDKTLKDMKSIIDGKSTAERFKTTELLNVKISDIQTNEKNGVNQQKEIFNTINEIEDAYSKRLVSDEFYTTNMPKLKASFFRYESKEKGIYSQAKVSGFIPFTKKKVDTVGTTMLQDVADLSAGLLNNITSDSLRFDATSFINKVITQKGLNPDSFDQSDIATYRRVITEKVPSIMRILYPSYTKNLTDEELMDKDIQRSIKQASLENKILLKSSQVVKIKGMEDLIGDYEE